jgi:DNA-binding LytR/AlgR family response regulator
MVLKTTYTCIIIDDERFARDLIAHYLREFPEFTILGKYKNTSLAKEVLKLNPTIDLIFLDIQMPNETGIEFLKNNTIQPKIILTTAYSEYALESYDLKVIDYLLKPIIENRFRKAIHALKNILETEEKATAFEILTSTSNDYLKIKSGALELKLFFYEIIRLDADDEYVNYITATKKYFILGSLKKIILQLPTSFIQVPRSHIINIKKVRGRKKYTLILEDNSQIPIGKTYRTKVLQILKSHLS